MWLGERLRPNIALERIRLRLAGIFKSGKFNAPQEAEIEMHLRFASKERGFVASGSSAVWVGEVSEADPGGGSWPHCALE